VRQSGLCMICVSERTKMASEAVHAYDSVLFVGKEQVVGDIVKQLHSAKLIGKNAASTKLFKKFPDRFELTPAKQPNQVRYLALKT
jgi:hypothetical protein